MRTLLVITNPTSQRQFLQLLSPRAHELTAAAPGEVPSLWASQSFDVVFTDNTGIIRQVRTLPSGPTSVVVFVTSDDEDLEGALDEGANDFIVLPQSPSLLRTRIAVIERRAFERVCRRRVEVQLSETRSIVDTLFDQCPDAIAVWGPDGTLRRMNTTQRAYLGAKRSFSLLGRVNVLRDLGQNSAMSPLFRRAYLGETVVASDQGCDLSPLFPQQNPGLVADLVLCPIRADDGSITAVVSLIRDVTARHDLRRTHLRSERLATMGAVAACIAHDVNNPLAYVTANLAWLTDEIRRYGESIPIERFAQIDRVLHDTVTGAEHIGRVVSGIKTFSRQEEVDVAGPVEVPDVVEQALTLVHDDIRHRATLHTLLGDTPQVLCGPSRLTQVIVNLLGNAAQAIEPGQSDSHRIAVTTRTDHRGWAIIEVADTGIGIEETVRRRIFEPFFTTKPAGEGSGLGLPISLNIVREFGGSIDVESTPGVGSVFRISLPPTESEISVLGPDEPTTEEPMRAGRVLVIDDDEALGRAVCRLLRSEHDVEVVASGKEGVARIMSQAYDAVLCDLMLPGFSGIEVYEAIPPKLRERVLFMTGGSFTPRANAFLEEIPNPVISKPFEVESLRDAVRLVVARRQALAAVS